MVDAYKRIPGLPISMLPSYRLYEIFPDKARLREMFKAMTDKLASLGIHHNDFTADNVLFDEASQAFYPIDIDISANANMSPEQINAMYSDIYSELLRRLETEIDYSEQHKARWE